MTFNDNLAAHYANVEQSNIMNSFVKYYIDSELVALKALITGAAPETLDTLQELAAALSDDPLFFSNIAASVAAVQTDVDNNEAAADAARTALQTLLQAAIDAVQADVNQNETDSDAAIAAEASARAAAVSTETTNREAAVAALQALIDTLTTEAAARLVRIQALEADPTTATAVAAVQSDVDQNEADSDAADAALSARLDVLEADPTTATAVAAVQADVDQNEADADAAIATERGRIDAILLAADADKDSFAEIVTLINSVDTTNDNAFAAYVLSNDAAVAAVQSDVDQNESDSDAADAALSGRLDVLEADPTTATAVAAVQSDVDQNEADSDAADAALSGRLDTLEADPTTQTALTNGLALKADLAGATFTGDVTVDEGSGSTIKLETTAATSAGIHIEGPSGSMGYLDTTNGFGNDSLQVYSGLFWVRAINSGDGTAMFDGDVTLQSGLTVNGAVVSMPNLPGPYNGDGDASSNGVALGSLYYDSNSHVRVRVS